MQIRPKHIATALSLLLAVAVPLAGTVAFFPTEVMAKAAKKSTLPKPYVSKALRAVLMPVTKEVARKFRLAKGATGVMVVSVKPDGLGKLAGLKPGDVISTILGRQVKKPSDVDTIIAYFLNEGTQDYMIGGMRKNGRTYRAATVITPAYFYEPFDVYAISSWSSFSYETYSYSEYVSYYSEQIYTSYERSESYIQETITSTAFTQEMTSETSYEYSSYDEQIVDGTYVEGGSGSVWQDGETDVVYDTADDPALLEEPRDAGSDDADPFTASEGDPDFATADAEADAGDESEPALYSDDASAPAPDDAAAEDPQTTEDTAAVDDGTGAMDSSVDDGSGEMDPSVDDGTGAMDPSVDDGMGAMDAPAEDGSSDVQDCPGQIVDGVCIDSGSDPGMAEDAGGGDDGYYDTSGGGEAGGEDSGGGDSGGGDDLPQQ